MNNKCYELSVIGNTDVNHAEIMRKVEEVLNKHAEIVKVEEDGVRRLTYPILGHDKADYIFYNIVMKDEDAPVKISSVLNIADEVLRYLLVKVNNPKWAKKYEKMAAKTTA